MRIRSLLAAALAGLVVVAPATAADLPDLPWKEQNDWLLARIMTPEDATRFLGIAGVTLTAGGDDRVCTASPDLGVKCQDNWGGGSWGDSRAGQTWPSVAFPRGVSVGWSERPEDALAQLDTTRATDGVRESLPLEVSGFYDLGGRYPVGWSHRVSGGWYVTAYCDPPVTVTPNGLTSTWVHAPVPQEDLVACAKRLVREQFTKLDVVPVEVTPPAAPSGALLTVKGQTATVTWIAPEDDGGSPITAFEAASTDGSLACTAAPTAEVVQSCSAIGAVAGRRYAFTVVARNAAGVSAPSAPSRPSTYVERSSAPRGAKAKVDGTTAAVSWRRPASLGGLPVVRYVVTAIPGGRTCTTPASPCSVAGLEPSTRYRFEVRAINARGASAPARTPWVRTPAPPPPAAPAPDPVVPVPAPPEPTKPEQQVS